MQTFRLRSKIRRKWNSVEQESPPAWTPEAYRPPCSKYSLCCPNWVPPQQGTPPGRVPPRQGTPQPGYPPGQGTPPSQGTPWPGYPLPPPTPTPSQGTPPWLDLAGYHPPSQLPHGILGNVAKHYGIWVPPPGMNWQTKWNYNLPVVLRTRAVIKIRLHLRTMTWTSYYYPIPCNAFLTMLFLCMDLEPGFSQP